MISMMGNWRINRCLGGIKIGGSNIMYLKFVSIKNFRSLKDVKVTLNENTVLIGENNAGKTSFLDAIRIALSRINGRYSFDDYDYYMEESISSPKESEGIEIVLEFQERVAEEWEGYIMDTFGEAIQYVDDETELASIIIGVSSVYNIATKEYETYGKFLNKEYEEISSKIQSRINTFYNLVPIFYMQALRNIKDTFSSKSRLWGKFLKKANIPQEKLKELQKNIETLNKDIIDNDENLTKLVNALEEVQKVLDFQGEDLVSINALPMKSWDLLSKAQLVLNNAKHVSFPLEKHGQGTQSVTTILLFKAYIDILLEELNSNVAEAILMIEEPEAHLHPQAVRAVETVLSELDCQKIITTHSPYFLQNLDLLDLRLFKKNNGVTEVVKIIDKLEMPLTVVTDNLRTMINRFTDVYELKEEEKKLIIYQPISAQLAPCLRGCCKEEWLENYISDSINIFTKEEIYDLNIYVQRTRGEILFARKWILYEGQTEDVIIQYCAKMLGYNIDEYGISGICYRTNGSAGAFAKLAKVLGINWVLLGDKDRQGTSTINEIKKCGYTNEEIEKRVYLTNEKDIETEFVKNGFLSDYEEIIADKIDEHIKRLKESGNLDEYEKEIIKEVQRGKVENAYKLVERWRKRNMQIDEIPEFVKKFIEEVCKDD